jgi:HK97 family phage portal protein
MNIIERIKNRLTFWRVSHPRFFVGQNQAGVTVTEDTALAYSAVAACVRVVSETLASLPWQVYRRIDGGGREAMGNNSIQWLLNVQANPEMTAYVFRRTMIAHQLTWGNAYAEIERSAGGRTTWLWPLPPDRCCLERDASGALWLRVTGENGTQYLSRDNFLHFSDGGFDGIVGMSRVQAARRAIGAGIAQDVFASQYYANGASVGGVIENKTAKLSIEGREALLADFNEKYAGPTKVGKTLYLDNGMEYKQFSMPLTDAQFLETRRFQVEEIARWYGVPLHLLQDLTNANYAVSYEASKNFVEYTLRPLCVQHEQEANIRLFGVRSMGSVYSRVNLSGLLRGDPKTRGEYYKAMINAGVMNINEIRELEELNSIGPDGDEHYMQLNMTTIARIASGDAQAEASAPEAPEPEPEPQPENVVRSIAMAWRHEQKQEQRNV